MKAAWRHKATFRHATFTFKACYTGMCLLGGSGAVLLVLPDEANTRFATPRPRSLPRALTPPPLLPSPPLVFCPHGELTLSAWGDRSATWLDPVKAAEIRAANQGLPGDVRAAASAASARDVRAPNFFTVDGKGEPGRPQ